MSERERFTLRIEEEMYKRLKAITDDSLLSMNAWVVNAIKKEINRTECRKKNI